MFSTAPLPLAARVATAAAALVRDADDRRATVLGHALRLRTELRRLGYEVPDGRAPIVPVVVGDEAPTLRLAADLLERRVFAQAIRPPTVPRGTARLRVVPIATHSDTDLTLALAAFAEARHGSR